MKTATPNFFLIVRWAGLGLCAVLFATTAVLPRTAFGLNHMPPSFAETDIPIQMFLGKVLGDVLEVLGKKAWKEIENSVDSSPPPIRRETPPQQPASPPSQAAPQPAPENSKPRGILPNIGSTFAEGARAMLPRTAIRELTKAMREDDPETVDELIADGLDVNMRGEGGITFLHYVAALECPDVASTLIRHGARVNARADGGMTPLDYALLIGNPAVAAVLRRHGGKRGNR